MKFEMFFNQKPTMSLSENMKENLKRKKMGLQGPMTTAMVNI